MIKIFRFLAICTIGVVLAASSIAWAQTYKQVDVPFAGAIVTELVGGPNPQGTSVGAWEDSTGVFHGFTLTAMGVFMSFDAPHSTATFPTFISPQGDIVGDIIDSTTFVAHGFILSRRKHTRVDFPGAAGTNLGGISPSGELSGNTCSDPACGFFGAANTTRSFVRSTTGVFTIFDPPGATSSSASTVNPSGAVVGSYTDAVGELFHGYLLKNGTYTTIDFPGAPNGTFADGGNPQNNVIGVYFDAAGTGHGFVLSDSTYTSFDYPEAGVQLTEATGINPGGVIVGLFVDSAGVSHGFIRTP